MVFYCVLAMAVLGGVGVCFAAGGFLSAAWLYLLPVSVAACFLGALVLAVVFFALCCAVVDVKKPVEKDSPFYRALAHGYIDLIIRLFRIRMETEGADRLPKAGRFMLVCNHLSQADPALLLWRFRKAQLAFISKQENYNKPLIAQVMHKLYCQSLRRENDREALKTILKCVDQLKQDQVNVAAFPEGYTSKDGKLHNFRHGVFKVAQKAGVPIVVCTLRGSDRVFSNMLRLKPSHVKLHVVGVIAPEAWKGATAVQIGVNAHSMMAADLGKDLVSEE